MTGVCFDKNRGKWLVRYGRKGFYGRYSSYDEAVAARQRAEAGVPYEGSSFDPKENLRNERGSASINWKGGKPTCEVCQKPLSNYGYRWCKQHRTESTKGSNNVNWKGGITSEDRMLRRKFQRTIQALVFERDDYTCQICDVRGGSLQVDHIKRWSEYPALRFETENCRTVCMACHYYITFKRKLPEGVVWGHNLSRRVTA